MAVFRGVGHGEPMVTVQDVVRLVASRGAVGLGELEQEISGDGDSHALLQALDACVDHGYLRLALRHGGTEAPYRVTRRGLRLLAAADQAVAAA